jgi:DNA-binding transcriptional ArsR family regulator
MTEYLRVLPRRWRGTAAVFTALGDEQRQRILLMFGRDKELTIKQVADLVPLSRTAVSHHLRVLRACGVVRAQKRGKAVYLRIDAVAVLAAMDALRVYIRERFRF